ncbi:hypothetical protein ACFPGO_08365 [Arcanobacterium canis]|uniref:Uncharacterized protein n=1 Tax=Arcanobacterium canis TaxID=999183 RepID=A0ABY8FXI1_9ACTO|nr:hypothetical protein [Arcanobacterium canis]WFM83230.1 hypothetical protein P7079_07515 [Arcanobacterium canis]
MLHRPQDGIAQDKFVDGASFDLVVALYEFDERLRHGVFIELIDEFSAIGF